MTHGHELRMGLLEGSGFPGGRRQRGKNWDNCNSIINKIYLKKRKKQNTTLCIYYGHSYKCRGEGAKRPQKQYKRKKDHYLVFTFLVVMILIYSEKQHYLRPSQTFIPFSPSLEIAAYPFPAPCLFENVLKSYKRIWGEGQMQIIKTGFTVNYIRYTYSKLHNIQHY